MEQMEHYKRLIKFGAVAVILSTEIELYYLLWTHYYNHIVTTPFWRRGNWSIAGLYGTMLFASHNLYDDLKIGFFRENSTIYSQFLAILTANVFGYPSLVLVEHHWYAVPYTYLQAHET